MVFLLQGKRMDSFGFGMFFGLAIVGGVFCVLKRERVSVSTYSNIFYGINAFGRNGAYGI